MHYTSKLNSVQFYLLYNKTSFFLLKFLSNTWSSVESITYKEEAITFFYWPLYLQGICSIHRKPPHFLNFSSWKSKIRKKLNTCYIPKHISFLLLSCVFFCSSNCTLSCLIFKGLGTPTERKILISFVKYGSYPHVKILANRLSVTLQ